MNKYVTTVHEGKKPFKCNICDAGFVSEADLNRLNASVHEGRKVQCDFCVSSFTKENNFQCSICDTRDWTATFVIRVFQIKAIWINMWQQVMKERNLSIAVFVILATELIIRINSKILKLFYIFLPTI